MTSQSTRNPTFEPLEPRLLMSAASEMAELFAAAQPLDLPAAGSVTVEGSLAQPGETAMYCFTVPARGKVAIDMKAVGGDIDPVLETFRGWGTRARTRRNDNASRQTLDSRIVLRSREGRSFYVQAGGKETSGEYQLTLTSLPVDDCGNDLEAAKTRRLNRRGKGRLGGRVNYTGDVDVIEIVARRTGIMNVQMRTPGRRGDLVGELFTPGVQGQESAGDAAYGGSQSTVSLDVVSGQTYYIAAAGSGSSTGRYRINVTTEEQIYYVSPAGSIAGDGSREAPWPSVNEALDQIGYGGVTLVLLPGEYGPIYFYDGYSGNRSHQTVVRSETPWTAAIVGRPYGLFPYHAISGDEAASWITLEGLEIRNGRFDGVKLYGEHNTVRGCWVHHNGLRDVPPDETGRPTTFGMGVELKFCLYGEIEGCLVESNGSRPGWDHGIYVGNVGHRVVGNVVRNNATGIHAYPALRGSRIEGNLVYGHADYAGILIGSAAPPSRNYIVRNRLLANGHKSGLVEGVDVYEGDPGAIEDNICLPVFDTSPLDVVHSARVNDYLRLL